MTEVFTPSYGPFASSALAGQSLSRESGKTELQLFTFGVGNIMSTVLPLFTDQMFRTLGYKWANTLFGLIAVIMIPIPFVRRSDCSVVSIGSDLPMLGILLLRPRYPKEE